MQALERGTPTAPTEEYERRVLESVDAFDSLQPPRAPKRVDSASHAKRKGDTNPVFRRHPEPRGPLEVFGYDYFADHAKAAGIATPKLLSYDGEWGAGAEYAYEALNLVDGKRSVQQIADDLAAEYGPIPTDLVLEYLTALKGIGLVD